MKCDKIVDLKTYASINNGRQFFLDTNVLYWYANPRFASPSVLAAHSRIYYDFIDRLVAAGNPLVTSIYNLTELLNVIEKNEFDIYAEIQKPTIVSKKDFRRNPAERVKLKQIMLTTLNNVKSICTVKEFDFTENTINNFVDSFTEHRCDVFDYCILQDCIGSGYVNVVSDDDDFSTMEKITLYTANDRALSLN